MSGIGTFILLLGLSATAFAAEVSVKIPQEGWSISFQSPSLSQKEESKRNGDYSFRANSGRFNVSLFVERPHGPGRSHKDCYAFYWPQARRNPMIAKDTVEAWETPKFVRVQYDTVAQFQGKPIRQRHANYYFAFRGKWVDVHISIIAPSEQDADVFETFDRTLSYGP